MLGRLASQVAVLLRGKHKPTFAPHVDTGDFVVIINADKVALTGAKLEQKKAYRHSGYPGGLRRARTSRCSTRTPRGGREGRAGHAARHSLAAAQLEQAERPAGPSTRTAAQKPQPFEITQVAQ